MDEIKSAWEIALDRTKDIKLDRKALKEKELVTTGKKIASQYLDDPAMNDIVKELKKTDPSVSAMVKSGIISVLLSNFVLPINEFVIEKNNRIKEAFLALSGKSADVKNLFSQIDGFFQNYSAERNTIEASLEQQYAPRLKQKEAALAQQMGQPVELHAAQDPEFVALLKKQLSLYDDKYQEVLNQAKDELKRLLTHAGLDGE